VRITFIIRTVSKPRVKMSLILFFPVLIPHTVFCCLLLWFCPQLWPGRSPPLLRLAPLLCLSLPPSCPPPPPSHWSDQPSALSALPAGICELLLGLSIVLMMVVVRPFETSVSSYQTTRRILAEDNHLQRIPAFSYNVLTLWTLGDFFQVLSSPSSYEDVVVHSRLWMLHGSSYQKSTWNLHSHSSTVISCLMKHVS
jgi:hypothetical protein